MGPANSFKQGIRPSGSAPNWRKPPPKPMGPSTPSGPCTPTPSTRATQTFPEVQMSKSILTGDDSPAIWIVKPFNPEKLLETVSQVP